MSADRLAEIRARVEKATKGPWATAVYREDKEPIEWLRENLSHGSGPLHGVWCPEHPLTIGTHPDPDHAVMAAVTGNGPTSKPNSDFIAHAREDVPFLLARVAALEEGLREAVRIIDDAAPGAFNNGNTNESGYIDEGEVLTSRRVDEMRALLATAEKEGT